MVALGSAVCDADTAHIVAQLLKKFLLIKVNESALCNILFKFEATQKNLAEEPANRRSDSCISTRAKVR